MIRYLFGLGEDTTKLVDQPTIDYSNTNYDTNGVRTNLYDSDFTTNSVKSLPTSYPGKFNTKSSKDTSGSQDLPIPRSNLRSFENDRTSNNWKPSINNDAFTSVEHKYNQTGFDTINEYRETHNGNLHHTNSLSSSYGKANTNDVYKVKDYDSTNYNYGSTNYDNNSTKYNYGSKSINTNNYDSFLPTSEMTMKLNQMKQSAQNTIKPREFQFDLLSKQVEKNNQFLNQVNHLIDANEDYQNSQEDIVEKFQNLKETYIKDSKKWEVFTENYLLLDKKYRELKSNLKSKSLVNLKENINKIKQSSDDMDIKSICNKLLQECDLLGDKDTIIENQRKELFEANEKIKQLELKNQ